MAHPLAQSTLTWAEDRAPVRTDPSAHPVAKTGAGARNGGGAGSNHSVPLPSCCRARALRDWHQRAKPSRHEVAKSSTGRPSQLANANQPKFQFPLNQDSKSVSAHHRQGVRSTTRAR